MQNYLIRNLDKKNVKHCTTNFGLYLRRKTDKPVKKACNVFTKANIIRTNDGEGLTNEEYFKNIDASRIPTSKYDLKPNKNNIVVERYPKLIPGKPYIFVCNHSCPEDIETILNVIDRNAYLVLGSVESLRYNPEMYLSFGLGMLPFDINDPKQRSLIMRKMCRVIRTNSFLIFPEASHNCNPSCRINAMYDGAVNVAIYEGVQIVPVSFLKDNDNNVTYLDFGNPLDIPKMYERMQLFRCPSDNVAKIKKLTAAIRDEIATANYYQSVRHFDPIKREDYPNIGEHFRRKFAEDAFSKLKWDHDVFDAEYKVKKTKDDRDYEETVRKISNLRLSKKVLLETGITTRDFVLREMDLDEKNVANYMRNYWIMTKSKQKLKKEKIHKR